MEYLPNEQILSPGERCFLEDFKGSAVLGGGAVRDTLYNVSVRDYDFYITETKGLPAKLAALGFEHARQAPLDKQYDHPDIAAVLKFPRGVMDVIILREGINPQRHIANFPISVSQASYTLADQVVQTTGAFDTTREGGPIVLYPNYWCNLNFWSMYVHKIHEKYPEKAMILDFEELPLAFDEEFFL